MPLPRTDTSGILHQLSSMTLIDLSQYSDFLVLKDVNDEKIKYRFHIKSNPIEGGEAVIYFGYFRDKAGSIQEVAIRLLRHEIITTDGRDEHSKASIDKVNKEIEANNILYRTSSLMRFADGRLAYFIEKIPGKDFAKSIHEPTGDRFDCSELIKLNLTFVQRCQIMRDLCRQLNLLHQANYCHGDINPTNVKIHIDVNGNANAYLFDLGQAILLEAKPFHELTEPRGMSQFIAPEVGIDKRYSQASDIYSIAGLFGMLFSAEPNEFIKLKKAAEEKMVIHVGGVDSHIKKAEQAATTDYNVDQVLTHPEDAALKSFMLRMTSQSTEQRPTSAEAFQFFDHIVKQYEDAIILQLDQALEAIRASQNNLIFESMEKMMKRRCRVLIRTLHDPMPELSKEMARFEAFCELANLYKNIKPMDITNAYAAGTSAVEFKNDVMKLDLLKPKEEKPLNLNVISQGDFIQLTNQMVAQLNKVTAPSLLFNVIQQWATAAECYHKNKSRSPMKLHSEQKIKMNEFIGKILEEVVRNGGDISKKTEKGDVTLEQELKRIALGKGTLASQAKIILQAHEEAIMRMQQLSVPSPQPSPKSLPRAMSSLFKKR